MLRLLHTHMAKTLRPLRFFGANSASESVGAKIGPTLDESIRALAIRKSLLCWYKINRLLKSKDGMRETFGFLEPMEGRC